MSFLERLFGKKTRTIVEVAQTSAKDIQGKEVLAKTGNTIFPSIEDTKAAMARLRPKLVGNQIDLWSFTSSVKSIAKQFSTSRKLSSKDAWFAREAYCLLEFREWVCLLSNSDSKIEPDEDLYYGALLAGLTGELPKDIIIPLYVRFFKDLAYKPEEEKRGHHTLNTLQLISTRLPEIEGLSIDYFRIKNIVSISAFAKLKALSIAGCIEINDFTLLANLKHLEVLRLDKTNIFDLSSITNLPKLRILSMIGCSKITVESIIQLAKAYKNGSLSSLKEVYLFDSGIIGVNEELLKKGKATHIFKAIASSEPSLSVSDFLLETDDIDTLLETIEKGFTEKAATLIQGNANIVQKKNNQGCTALHIAAKKGYVDLVKLILSNGANINAKDSEGYTPLLLAENHLEVVELLLANNADINASQNWGWTILLSAAKWDNTELARIVLANKPDLNIRNSDGNTPLHLASFDVMKLLLDAGAEINSKNNDGRTPLHEAVSSWSSKTEEVKLLIARNADINAKDNSGETPLSSAIGAENDEMVQLLRQNGGRE